MAEILELQVHPAGAVELLVRAEAEELKLAVEDEFGGFHEIKPVREVIGFLVDNRGAYGPMFLGLAVQGMLVIGTLSWLPSFFIRTHEWEIAKFGQVFGLILLFISPLGLLCGGWLAEKLSKKGYHDTNQRIVATVAFLILPLQLAFPLVPNPWFAIVLLGLLSLLGMFFAFVIFMLVARRSAPAARKEKGSGFWRSSDSGSSSFSSSDDSSSSDDDFSSGGGGASGS